MKRRLRAQQIVIDVPRPESEPWISLTIQSIDCDDNGKTVAINDRYDFVNKRLFDVAPELVTFDKNPAHPANQVTIVEAAAIIKAAVMAWIVARYNCVVDEDGNIVMED